MEVDIAQFQTNCVKLIDQVRALHTEVVIIEHGKPLAKLVYIQDESPKPFIGSFAGVGETVGDLLEPFHDEWENRIKRFLD